jgi:predicted nucleotidyltransferase
MNRLECLNKASDFGFSDNAFNLFISALGSFPEISQAAIFGSRAMGNYTNGSDVDVAIFGKDANEKVATRLSALLNESISLPYKFDVVAYETCKNADLKVHIDTYGKHLFALQSESKSGSLAGLLTKRKKNMPFPDKIQMKKVYLSARKFVTTQVPKSS